MYITCVCLFSALSRRVGALQISIIIIMIIIVDGHTRKESAACGERDVLKKKRVSH